MIGVREKYGLSERHACRIVSQPRGTQRYVPTIRADEDALTRAIVPLASAYGRSGDRRITALLQMAGWLVGRDRVSASGAVKGSRVPRNTSLEAGCGSTMAPASGCGPSGPITCGASTLLRATPMMGAACAS